MLVLVMAACGGASETALDEYVNLQDNNYSYSFDFFQAGFGYSIHVINLTSQQWRSPAEVSPSTWQHRLVVVVPDIISYDKAMLFISGGDNGDAPDIYLYHGFGSIAAETQSVVAYLEMVPNQPLYFSDETFGRWEDSIIAYSWDKFLAGGDAYWPVQLAMVKSAVRAMDAVQAYCTSLGVGVNSFVVTGASKRGWTAWLTAAVDERVDAVAPMVIDLLNLERSFMHHHRAYGFWAPAVNDYEQMGVFDWFGTTQMDELLEIVDPFAYNDRYDFPKFMINSTGDQFFLPDSARFYYDSLNPAGGKNITYLPNTDHGLGLSDFNSDVVSILLSFYKSRLDNSSLPVIEWTRTAADTLTVTVLQTPVSVKLWQAYNGTERDFRLQSIGAAWTSTELSDSGGGVYTATVSQPPAGFRAFMVQAEFSSAYSENYVVTTEVCVVPDYLPYAADFDFDGDIDSVDLSKFSSYWLTGDPFADIVPVDGDGVVEMADLSMFGKNWKP